MRKRIASIVFISILAFNWLGYRAVFSYLENKQSYHFEAQLDKHNYREDELISIKTHIPLPYSIQTEEFERWSGEVEVDGILYKYVKRRFSGNTVEYLCLPNHDGMMIKNAKEEFFRLATDLQTSNDTNSPHPAKKNFKNPLTEFFQEIVSYIPGQKNVSGIYYSAYLFCLPPKVVSVQEQPPEVA